MKKYLAAAAVVVWAFASAGCAPAKFANCAAMHSTYKGGIARPGAHQTGMVQQYAPYVNQAAYDVNAGLDRDHDGVACEA